MSILETINYISEHNEAVFDSENGEAIKLSTPQEGNEYLYYADQYSNPIVGIVVRCLDDLKVNWTLREG